MLCCMPGLFCKIGDQAGNKKLVFSLKANEYKCETTGLAEPENCEDFIHLPGRF